MDLDPTERERELRAETVAALDEPAVRGALDALRADPSRDPDPRPLYRELGRRGLLAVHWPVAHGGRGATPAEAAAVLAELVAAGVPDMPHVLSVQIVGAFLLAAGTPEQRDRHLPALAAGEELANVLYSEPDVGSDLAAVTTTAVPDGDGFRLDGVKVYGIGSARCRHALCVARTGAADAGWAGLTVFLVPLDAPGVQRDQLPALGDAPFDRVVLDGVRVGPEAVVGAVGEGWPLLVHCLSLERTGLDYALRAQGWFRAAASGLRDRGEPARAGVDDATLVELGRHGAAADAALLISHLVLDPGAADGPGADRAADTAAAKLFTSETAQDIANWAAAVHGGGYRLHELVDGDAALLEAAYREAPGLTLAAGTSEIMLDIVAGAVRRAALREGERSWI